MKKVIVALLLLGCGGLLYVKLTTGFFPIPLTLRGIWQLVSPPADLYDPMIMDDFHFHERGFSRTYTLQPKYLGKYELGLMTDQPVLLSDFQSQSEGYEFTGKLKLEFLWKDTLLFEQVADHMGNRSYLKGGLKWYREIDLAYFDIPFQGNYRYVRNISLRVTVIEPDEALKNQPSVKLFIAGSSRE